MYRNDKRRVRSSDSVHYHNRLDVMIIAHLTACEGRVQHILCGGVA